MKSAILEGVNQPFHLKSVDAPQLQSNEALVQLKTTALNHRDLWIQKGQYAGLKFPIILGSDGAGIVKECRTETTSLWLNQEVIICPSLNWGKHPQAQSSIFEILGLPRNGTFAEWLTIPADNLFLKPPHLSWEEAAALPLAGLTAYRALFSRAHLQSQENILITGVGGGVALFALQFALATHANVYVTSGSDQKIQRALQLGATHGVNYHHDNWHEQLQQEMARGFDVILDSAGGASFLHLIDLLRPGGRLVFMGATQGNPPELPMRKIFWKQLSLFGTTMGNLEEFGEMLHFVAAHQIKPILDSTHSLDEINNAFQRMERSEQFGKIVLKINE
ncbi:MAG: zinc-binding dehydrogenase [Verrucomicrobiia bacterium]